MNVVWFCDLCGVTGTYDSATIKTKTDASLPDAKHQADCPGTVNTATSESTLAAVRKRGAA